MKTTPRLFALRVAIFLIASCGNSNSQPNNPLALIIGAHTNQVAIHSTPDLRQRLRLGMDTNQITALFGAPDHVLKLSDGTITWMYSLSPFPAPESKTKGDRVLGLTLEITNGCLMFWGEIYGGGDDPSAMAQQHSIEPKNNPRRDASTSLKFFVVNSNAFMVGQVIPNEQLSKLAGNSDVPSLTISHLKDTTWRTWDDHMWRVDVWFEPDDVAKMKSLTETNISKTMLLVVGHQLVSAGEIKAPITYGVLFKGSEQSELDAIKIDLSNLISR